MPIAPAITARRARAKARSRSSISPFARPSRAAGALAAILIALPALAQPRIVALSPALAVILRDLGLESRIVARHAYDLALNPDLPVAGDQLDIDYETLLRIEPTHVLLQWGARELPPRLLSIGESKGWVIQSIPLLTLDDIRAAVVRLDALLADETSNERAAALLEQMNRAWSVRPALDQRAGRCLALYATAPPAAAGPGSFSAQLLEAVGVRPAIADGAPYLRLDLEDLRALDPDSIVLFAPGAAPESLPSLLEPLSRARLRAVESGRVALIGHPLAQTPSTAMIEVADQLADAIAAWTPLDQTGE